MSRSYISSPHVSPRHVAEELYFTAIGFHTAGIMMIQPSRI
jgi:hypothetical protein